MTTHGSPGQCLHKRHPEVFKFSLELIHLKQCPCTLLLMHNLLHKQATNQLDSTPAEHPMTTRSKHLTIAGSHNENANPIPNDVNISCCVTGVGCAMTTRLDQRKVAVVEQVLLSRQHRMERSVLVPARHQLTGMRVQRKYRLPHMPQMWGGRVTLTLRNFDHFSRCAPELSVISCAVGRGTHMTGIDFTRKQHACRAAIAILTIIAGYGSDIYIYILYYGICTAWRVCRSIPKKRILSAHDALAQRVFCRANKQTNTVASAVMITCIRSARSTSMGGDPRLDPSAPHRYLVASTSVGEMKSVLGIRQMTSPSWKGCTAAIPRTDRPEWLKNPKLHIRTWIRDHHKVCGSRFLVWGLGSMG